MRSRKGFLVVLLMLGMVFISSYVSASTILGFTTRAESGSNFDIYNAGGSLRTLDFGNLSVTEAKSGSLSISELIDAEVLIDDVTINVATEAVEATFGGTKLYSYSITNGTITDGFKLKVGSDIVLEADLTLSNLYAYGKSGMIDPGLGLNLTNVDIFTSGLGFSADTINFLNDFISGADLVLSLAADNILMRTGLQGTTSFHGVVGGTSTPVPEPISYFFMGWGALVLYALRKLGFWIRY